jgi:broad specificity phosphatase PhoE
LSTYHFTFLNCTGVYTHKALTAHLESTGYSFAKIIASPESQAQSTAKAIQQSIQSELRLDTNWGLAPGHEGNSWQLHLIAGHALKSLFTYPPGHYLVITSFELLKYALAIILGENPQRKPPGTQIHITPGTSVTFKYDLSDLKWNLLRIYQPETSQPDPDNAKYHFSLIRHGESIGNVKRVFQGQKDFPLSEKGKQQAESLARRLINGGSRYHKIIVSPLTRTMQTAKPISTQLGLPIQVDELWIEINNGNLAGVPGNSREENGEDRQFNPFTPIGEYGESWWDLYLRGGEALLNLLKNPPGNYLVVSHGGTLNAVLWNVLGTPPQPGTLTHTIHFENTGIANISYNPTDQNWQLISLLPGAQL